MSKLGKEGVQYGLIIKNKAKPQPAKKPLISEAFKNESDSEDEFTKANFDKALAEDPSVFQYDEIYEEISSKKEQEIAKKKKDVKTASERKLEQELLMERKAQKEINEEKEKYADKEEYVTSAYKAKMEELRNLVKKRKEEEQTEEIMDVTKQDGMGGFYRYMYNKQHGDLNKFHKTDPSENSESKEEVQKPPSRQTNSPVHHYKKKLIDTHHDRDHKSPVERKIDRRKRDLSPHSSHRVEYGKRSRSRSPQNRDDRHPRHSKRRSRSPHSSRQDKHERRSPHYSDRSNRPRRRSKSPHSSHSRRRSRSPHQSHSRPEASRRRSRSRSPNSSHCRSRNDHHRNRSPDNRRRRSRSPHHSNADRSNMRRSRSPAKPNNEPFKKPEKPVEKEKIPDGFVKSKPRVTTEEELKEMLERYFERCNTGKNRPIIVVEE